jgi:hypothetical protein
MVRSRRRAAVRVPLDRDLLRVLVDESGLSQTALAKKLRTNQQTLSHHLRGPGMGKCHAELRRRLARYFATAEDELSGAGRVRLHSPLCADGYEFLYSDATRRAASRMLHKVGHAVLADLEQRQEQATQAERAIRTAPPDIVIHREVLGEFAQLLMVSREKRRLLVGMGTFDRYWLEPIPANFEDAHAGPLPDNQPHESAIVGVVRYWEHVLALWFRREASLNYRVLRLTTHPEDFRERGLVASLTHDHPWTIFSTLGDHDAADAGVDVRPILLSERLL